jgi:hypothetical protein
VRPADCLGDKLKFCSCTNKTQQEGKLIAFDT